MISEQNADALPRCRAVLLFGMPGVGKGTQGVLLGTMQGMFHVSTGAIFRGLDPATDDGRDVASYIDHGNLVPNELCLRIWRHWLKEQIDRGTFDPQKQILLLDGLPRSVQQCEMLQDHVDVISVLYLACEDIEPLIERLKGRAADGRADDRDEAIVRRRFDIYRKTTQPVLDFYPRELIQSVDPIGTPMQIKKRILEALLPRIRETGVTLAELA